MKSKCFPTTNLFPDLIKKIKPKAIRSSYRSISSLLIFFSDLIYFKEGFFQATAFAPGGIMALTFFVKRRSRIVAKINSSLFFVSSLVSQKKLAVSFSTPTLSLKKYYCVCSRIKGTAVPATSFLWLSAEEPGFVLRPEPLKHLLSDARRHQDLPFLSTHSGEIKPPQNTQQSETQPSSLPRGTSGSLTPSPSQKAVQN